MPLTDVLIAPQLGGSKARSERADSLVSDIVEIRQDREELDLLQGIRDGLRPGNGGQKSLPTLLLYDEKGLQLFEQITYLDEYYLTNAEIEVLKTYADRIVERIAPNSIVLELGSGNLRKVRILLDAFEAAEKPVEYYALDVSLQELERTLADVPPGTFKWVKCSGLHGTYDDGLVWLQSEEIASRPKAVLSLGSSIGNFSREEGAGFLRSFAEALRPGDTILAGMDACKDAERVYHAYNDREGVTHQFILNGLMHANQLLKQEAFDLRHWRVIGEYDEVAGKHHAFVSPSRDVVLDGVLIKANERIFFEQSFKYDDVDKARLWVAAGLQEGARWTNAGANYGLHMAYPEVFAFPAHPRQYAAQPVPSYAEWRALWGLWDTVTQGMIPKKELLAKPIKLRNACIFYVGHIPTFLAIHLHRATGKSVPKLAEYKRIFERGIDPDVENPEQCHAHSEIPDEYPPESEILEFQAGVRELVRELCTSGASERDFATSKALWLGFEHEAMHVETLLYMLVQSEKTLPPPNAVRPDFAAQALEAQAKEVPNKWIEVPSRTITLGLDDDDADLETKRYFGWDNEKPSRKADVRAFLAQARPITNGEYAKFLEATGSSRLPASWTVTPPTVNGSNGEFSSRTNGHAHEKANGHANGYANGHANGYANGHANGHANGTSNGTNGVGFTKFLSNKAVCTVFGAIPLQLALHWPIMASYDELAAYADWYGGRIPSLEEVKSIYEHAEQLKTKHFDDAHKIPAVNGHLLNDGVEETPPSKPSVNGASRAVSSPHLDPHALFVNLEGANVGFKQWYQTPVTQLGNKLAGQGEMGGAWEWTSTVLEKHGGFEPMELYPGYTADFFDKKHNIVLGGSWATHPRVAGRKSFVNWYQRNYPYVWATARLVKDL